MNLEQKVRRRFNPLALSNCPESRPVGASASSTIRLHPGRRFTLLPDVQDIADEQTVAQRPCHSYSSDWRRPKNDSGTGGFSTGAYEWSSLKLEIREFRVTTLDIQLSFMHKVIWHAHLEFRVRLSFVVLPHEMNGPYGVRVRPSPPGTLPFSPKSLAHRAPAFGALTLGDFHRANPVVLLRDSIDRRRFAATRCACPTRRF